MVAVSAPNLPAYHDAVIPCVQAYFNDVMADRSADVVFKTWCNSITSEKRDKQALWIISVSSKNPSAA